MRAMAAGATRFSELRRGVPLMSPTLLSRRLKQLEAEGVIDRRNSKNQGKATYHLTQNGREFVPLVEALGVWGQRWSRRELADNEIDLGLLIWSLERNVKADAFGPARAVVQLVIVDQPAEKSMWWFVNENGGCELCLQDPGYDVDLYLSCTLPDMIHIVRGDSSLTRAIGDDHLEVIGAAAAGRKRRAWLNLGPLTKIRSQRP